METVFDTERDERTLHQIPPDEYTAHTQANGINTSENPPPVGIPRFQNHR